MLPKRLIIAATVIALWLMATHSIIQASVPKLSAFANCANWQVLENYR